jgi:L-threonylcarbamoyladenylate synthase
VVGEVWEKQEGGACEAPGELPYHYAPHRPLKIVESAADIKDEDSSFLAFRQPLGTPGAKHTKVLSREGNLREAAANFFSYLIDLDRDDVKVIYAERIPEEGIGKAMMERLRKASRKGGHITP